MIPRRKNETIVSADGVYVTTYVVLIGEAADRFPITPRASDGIASFPMAHIPEAQFAATPILWSSFNRTASRTG